MLVAVGWILKCASKLDELKELHKIILESHRTLRTKIIKPTLLGVHESRSFSFYKCVMKL